MDDKRRAAGQKLLDAAHEFFRACHEEGQRGAVQWLRGSDGELVIFTRGEYRETLMANIDKLANLGVHYFNGEAMPADQPPVSADQPSTGSRSAHSRRNDSTTPFLHSGERWQRR